MVIKTGRRMSSLELGNSESNDANLAPVSSSNSNSSNANNRSMVGHQPFVIPVDYSFAHSNSNPNHINAGGKDNSHSSQR